MTRLRASLVDVESKATMLKEEVTRLRALLIDVEGEATRLKEETTKLGHLLKLKRKLPSLSAMSQR